MPLDGLKKAALLSLSANLQHTPRQSHTVASTKTRSFSIQPNAAGVLDDRKVLAVGGPRVRPIAAACGAYISDWLQASDNTKVPLVDISALEAAVASSDVFLADFSQIIKSANDVVLAERIIGHVAACRDTELPMFILSATTYDAAAQSYNKMARAFCANTPNAIYINANADPARVSGRINTELLWIEELQAAV